MPLTAADKTRIYQYGAFQLGSGAGGELTTSDVLELIQQQMNNVNAIDAAQGTTFAAAIQTDLDRLDTLDATLNTNADQGSIKVLGLADGIEYFDGGSLRGYRAEFGRLRSRIARVLSQTYSPTATPGITPLLRG